MNRAYGSHMLRTIPWLTIIAAACGGAGSEDALRATLAGERRAHLEADAALLASSLDDSLVSLSDGQVQVQTREDVEAMFRSYFSGAAYARWEDLTDPVIRIAPGGRMAWVARRVAVEREEPAFGGGTRRRSFVSAWSATYRYTRGRWRMATVTSTFEPADPSRQIVAGARRAAGWTTLPDSLRAHATVTGPGGPFEVTVVSAASGGVRATWIPGPTGVITSDSSWWVPSPGTREPLAPVLREFVRGHEVHYGLLAPDTRHDQLRYGGRETFNGVPALRVTAIDGLGGPVDIYYAAGDTMPLGFRVVDHLRQRGPVVVTAGDWTDVNGRRIFRSAEFVQGQERFRYRYVELALHPDS